jgi:hypothetical protein
MFLLRRRVPSVPRSTIGDFADSNSVDSLTGSSLDCSTPGVKRSKIDQTLSTQRPNTIPRGRTLRRRLSENEKARISIYIQFLDAMLAALIAMMKTFGKLFISAIGLVKAKGASEVLYLVGAVFRILSSVTGLLGYTTMTVDSVALHTSIHKLRMANIFFQ